MTSFEQFNLSEELKKGIKEIGFTDPSPIQAECIPAVISGGDLIGQAHTGTGKTAAFGIPLLEKINPKLDKIQSIILTPTRELAIQVSKELKSLSKFKRIKVLPVYGGQVISGQIRDLRSGVQVVVGTPGRLLDHLRRGTIKASDVGIFVLDEADEMLDMGFIDDILAVLDFLPKERQLLLFSATMPREIRNIARKYMRTPQYITVSRGAATVPIIEQRYYRTSEGAKTDSLCRIIDNEEIDLAIIFCRTKKGVDDLSEILQRRGYLASGLHGDLVQQQRDRVMNAFRNGKSKMLIATDVAARGIDVDSVSHVINYDIPQDSESYVHRIGRTGRAGRDGVAITFVTPSDMNQLRQIERQTGAKLQRCDLPTLEEVASKQRSIWADQIRELLASGKDLTLFSETIEELKQEFESDKIAAAALQIIFAERFEQDKAPVNQFGDTGASKGMVRFFLSLGRSSGITPPDITRAIVDQAAISQKEIGRISLYDRFSFVEVSEAVASFVHGAMRKSKINGMRSSMDPAHPRRGGKR